jgi:hypothetical protein
MVKIIKRKVPPSRTRYEQNNPTVSFRVHKDIYDRVQQTKSVGGNSSADIFMAGLGKMEARAKKLEEARKKGWEAGYKKGFADAELRYKICYPCNICGEPIAVTTKEERDAIAKCLQSWVHKECWEQRRRSTV